MEGRYVMYEASAPFDGNGNGGILVRDSSAFRVAVIDGPYDSLTLSPVLAREPINLADSVCRAAGSPGCSHGTFIMGLLGARLDAPIPGYCPEVGLLHIPLFLDDQEQSASLEELAKAITTAVSAGARLINLSLAIADGEGDQGDRSLALALDHAEQSGAVILAAAGNQGSFAVGQLLSHPVTLPVVAVDATGKILPNCNLGPVIRGRGLAALGRNVLGYAPGGGTMVMSGTSVATAIATGLLAQAWSKRPDVDGVKIRSALASLARRDGNLPPILSSAALMAIFDSEILATRLTNVSECGGQRMNHASWALRSDIVSTRPVATSGAPVVPAQAPGGCGCGETSCACKSSAPLNFVYVLGTVDVRFPDQSIAEELQSVGGSLKQGAREDMRAWCHRVLSQRHARYVARKLCWVLTVEWQPAYYLILQDTQDFGDLIDCLDQPINDDLCLFVGTSTMKPIEECPGVTAPALLVDQFSAAKKSTLAAWFGTPKNATPTTTELFNKLVQSADNFGDTDEWRALNYLAFRYKPLYDLYASLLHDDYALVDVSVVRSRLWGNKHIVDPIFSFQSTKTTVVYKYFVRVDVTYLFPMIAHHLTELAR
jgi:hypothetical protein